MGRWGSTSIAAAAGVPDNHDTGGWDSDMGQYDEEDFGVLPAAIRNLNNPVAMRSGMGPGSDAILTDGEELRNYVDEERAAAVVYNDDTSCSDHTITSNWYASYRRSLSSESD